MVSTPTEPPKDTVAKRNAPANRSAAAPESSASAGAGSTGTWREWYVAVLAISTTVSAISAPPRTMSAFFMTAVLLVLRDAKHVVDVPAHEVLQGDHVPEEVLVAFHAVHLVAVAREEVVQLAPVGRRGLPEAEHLHLEVGTLAANQILEGLQDGQVESFGVHLDEAEAGDEVGMHPTQEVPQVLPVDPDLEGAAVLPLAHALVKPAVREAGFAVLELVHPVGPHRGEHQRHNAGLPGVEAGVAFEHREHVRVGLEREHETRRADRQRDRDRGVAGVGADVDRDVAGAQEAAPLIHGRLRWRAAAGARVQPPGDLEAPLPRKVVPFDHESERFRLRFEAEQVDELLGSHRDALEPAGAKRTKAGSVSQGASPRFRNTSPPPARFFLPRVRPSALASGVLARVRSAAVLGIDAYLVCRLLLEKKMFISSIGGTRSRAAIRSSPGTTSGIYATLSPTRLFHPTPGAWAIR